MDLTAPRLLGEMDTNDDGKVSWKEFSEALTAGKDVFVGDDEGVCQLSIKFDRNPWSRWHFLSYLTACTTPLRPLWAKTKVLLGFKAKQNYVKKNYVVD